MHYLRIENNKNNLPANFKRLETVSIEFLVGMYSNNVEASPFILYYGSDFAVYLHESFTNMHTLKSNSLKMFDTKLVYVDLNYFHRSLFKGFTVAKRTSENESSDKQCALRMTSPNHTD